MRTERYPSVEENGREGAERIAKMHLEQGAIGAVIGHGQIPQWGSAIPGSSTFGKTETGYMVIVTYDK